MRKLTTFRCLALSILFWGSLTTMNGQIDSVIVLATHEIGEPTDIVKVKIKVVDFESMLNTQFTLRYDTAIVAFSSVGDYGIFNINDQNFGIPEGPFPTPKGIISFLWIADNIITGHSLADSTVLFSVSFEVIGEPCDVSDIIFADEPTDIEFGNLQGEMPFIAYNGLVSVGDCTATEEVVTEDFIFYPISPNPIQEEAFVRFSLRQSAQISLVVHDQSGKLVFRDKRFFGNGSQVVSLKKEVFPASGTYFVSLTTENAQAVQKLIVVR